MKMPKYFYTEEKSTGEVIVHKRNAEMSNYCSALAYIGEVHPKLQSDYCRYNARMIAEMASRGHITSINKYIRQAGNRWLLTRSGAELASSYECC